MPVIAQSFWDPDLQRMSQQFEVCSGRCLHWNPQYEAAKKGGDADAALKIIHDTVSRKQLNDLHALIAGRDVTFLAPFVPRNNGGRNILPITFAHFLARHFGAKVADDVRQVARVGRKEMDGIDKLLHQPTFAGTITPGTHYVLVDDSVKDGGTAATLRSFVEKAGGRVVCVAALADCAHSLRSLHVRTVAAADLSHMLTHNIAVTSEQLRSLNRKAGPHAGSLLERYCHFGLDTLTSGEAHVVEQYGRNLRWVLERRCLAATNATSAPGCPSGGIH